MSRPNTTNATPQGRVLLICQDQAMTVFAKTLFEKEGFEVEGCASIWELSDNELASFRLILVDMTVANADLLQEIAHVSQLSRNCPIIVTSDYIDSGNIMALLNAGANDYIIKPFSSRELMVRVNKLLGI